MSDSDLSNQYIDDTFDGLLHMQGDPLPSSGVGIVYDGVGNKSALSLGRQGVGVTITGNLSSDTLNVGALEYPSTAGNENALLYQESSKKIGRLDKGNLSNEYLKDLNPSPYGTYSGGVIDSININSKGLVTSIALSEDPSDDQDTDPKTKHPGTIGVSKTYYFKKPQKIWDNIEIDYSNNPKEVSVLDVVPSTAKAIIGYVTILATTSNNTKLAIGATHDNTITPKRWNLIHNGWGSNIQQDGNQFACLLNTTTKKFYVAMVSDIEGLINNRPGEVVGTLPSIDIWIIGYQE